MLGLDLFGTENAIFSIYLFMLKQCAAIGTSILRGVDEVQAVLDEQVIKTQGMRASPYIGPFQERVHLWESKLNSLQDILDNWVKCQ